MDKHDSAQYDRALSQARQLANLAADLSLAQRQDIARILSQVMASAPPAPIPPAASSHRAYFDYALTGMVETDAQWRIRDANSAASSITGYSIRRLKELGLPMLCNAQHQEKVRQHLLLLQEQGIHHSTWHVDCPDGRAILIEISSTQVADDQYIHVFDDVTEQRIAAEAIDTARLAAEAANKAKSEFLANMSHEIRTPMNGIIGLAQLTLMTRLTAEQRDHVEQIAQSGRSLLQIINNLLDFSKVESGRVEFERLAFSLDELLDEMATLAAQKPGGQQLEIAFQIAPDVPRQLVGDRLRLGQCLVNLIGNAIKFTPKGHVILRVSVASQKNGQLRLQFEVEDSGIGMSSDVMARLFQPFSQADASIARRFGGSGLGLAIARALAQGMDGELEVQSEEGRGSIFTLSLPFLVPSLSVGSASSPPLPAAPRVWIEPRRRATRQGLQSLLEHAGWEVVDERDVLGASDLVVLDAVQDDAWKTASTIAQGNEERPCILMLTGIDDPQSPPLDWEDIPRLTCVTRPLTPLALQRALRRLGLSDTPNDDAIGFEDVPTEYAGRTILVAEDNHVNQIVILSLLQRAGIVTRLALDGHQVLKRMENLTTPPDLILMDVQMPNMDGLATTRILRDQGITVPIIGLSAGVSKQEQNACLDAGMNDFLGKPLDTDELWGCLTRWIAPTDPLDAPPQVESVQARFLNDQDTLHRAQQAFVHGHGDDGQKLLAMLDKSELADMGRLVHALKGASATIGATEVNACSKALEGALKQEAGKELLQRLVDELDDQLAKSVTELLAFS